MAFLSILYETARKAIVQFGLECAEFWFSCENQLVVQGIGVIILGSGCFGVKVSRYGVKQAHRRERRGVRREMQDSAREMC